MLRIHCRGVHGTAASGAVPSPEAAPPGTEAPERVDGLCGECAVLWAYVRERAGRCPFLEDKPTCVDCPVHCYRGEMRERVRQVMRYAGPRMGWRHPVLALFHLLDGRRKGGPAR
jgi:hypothetical protein